jgi:hypothetical protein
MSGADAAETAIMGAGWGPSDSGSRPPVCKDRFEHGTVANYSGVDKRPCAERWRHLGSLPQSPKLKIVVDRDPCLFNRYAVMLVNSARHPEVKADLGMAFIDWLTSRQGQNAIANYKINGEQLFFPN